MAQNNKLEQFELERKRVMTQKCYSVQSVKNPAQEHYYCILNYRQYLSGNFHIQYLV